MELVSATDTAPDLQSGTAGDHYALARAHLWRAFVLSFCGPSKSAVVRPQAENLDGKQFSESNEAATVNPGVFLPSDSWKEAWDLLVLAAIIYSAVSVPYRICFSDAAEPGTSVYVLEESITALFITDVFFNFNTAYMEDDVWVTHRSKIAAKYLSGWFWIDAPSSVPVELIDFIADLGAPNDEGDASRFAALRFLRLFRLLRLLRLLKLNEYIAHIEVPSRAPHSAPPVPPASRLHASDWTSDWTSN